MNSVRVEGVLAFTHIGKFRKKLSDVWPHCSIVYLRPRQNSKVCLKYEVNTIKSAN